MKIDAIRSRIAGAETRGGTARSSATLTDSFVEGPAIDVDNFGMLVLLVKYTQGSGESNNAVVLKVELSRDGTNFHQQTNNQAFLSLSTYTFVAVSSPGTYDQFTIAVPIAAVKYARVAVKEINVASNYGTCEVKYALGW